MVKKAMGRVLTFDLPDNTSFYTFWWVFITADEGHICIAVLGLVLFRHKCICHSSMSFAHECCSFFFKPNLCWSCPVIAKVAQVLKKMSCQHTAVSSSPVWVWATTFFITSLCVLMLILDLKRCNMCAINYISQCRKSACITMLSFSITIKQLSETTCDE